MRHRPYASEWPNSALRIEAKRAYAALVAFLAATAMLAGGCGEDSEDGHAQGVGPVKVGSIAAGAQCRDWNAGTEEQKLATIEDIRSQINLEDAPVDTPALTDDQAYELFEHACAEDFAAGFKLYKLYAQRAGFQPLAP
jgi:hypothetical protein